MGYAESICRSMVGATLAVALDCSAVALDCSAVALDCSAVALDCSAVAPEQVAGEFPKICHRLPLLPYEILVCLAGVPLGKPFSEKRRGERAEDEPAEHGQNRICPGVNRPTVDAQGD